MATTPDPEKLAAEAAERATAEADLARRQTAFAQASARGGTADEVLTNAQRFYDFLSGA